MVKDLFSLSMEVKEGERFKPSHLHLRLVGQLFKCLNGLNFQLRLGSLMKVPRCLT